MRNYLHLLEEAGLKSDSGFNFWQKKYKYNLLMTKLIKNVVLLIHKPLTSVKTYI